MNMKRSTILQLLILLVLAVLIFFGVHTTIESRVVEGSSMQSTLFQGERLVVVKAAYWFGEPQRGDVVIFKYPDQGEPQKTLVKRVIGLPGEQIEIKDGMVYINGSPLEEPYVKDLVNTSCLGSYCKLEIPAGQYFVMGDNRTYSSDSRYFGTVPRKDIIGRVWLLYWPLSDWHLVRGYAYGAH